MAAEKQNLIWIPIVLSLIGIVLALIGWVWAYFSPLYHESKRKPNITAQYKEIDFKHFIAHQFVIANEGNAEGRQVQCILPRFIFPGGGTPCSTSIRDISPHHVRYTLDNLSDKRILTIYNMVPEEKFFFTVYKGCFDSIGAYYELKPSIAYDTLLDGVRVRTTYGDIQLSQMKREKPKRRPSEEKPSS